MITISRIPRRAAVSTVVRTLLLLATVGSSAACGLLDVTDPTRLEEHDVADPTGADLMRKDALRHLFMAETNAAVDGGIMTDEFHIITTGTPNALDIRLEDGSEDPYWHSPVLYRTWHEVRHAATLALNRIEADAAEDLRSTYMGQMLAVRGYAVVRLAEDFCPGFPLHELDGYTTVYGEPLETTDEVFEYALRDLDLAVTHAADSAGILSLASIVRGRALSGLGRFAEAAEAVQAVPTDYVFLAEYGMPASGFNQINELFRLTDPCCGPIGSVSDGEGQNGLDFVSAGDPRVPTDLVQTVDGMPRYRTGKYPDWDAPMVLASGVEARLIEAEAALASGGPWLEILNDLRATRISPPLEPLADPGDADARVDLLFRERAFWLFATGHRLADLHRLIRHYGRSSESVFPTGASPMGRPYGTATRMKFPWETEAEFNPAVTGCTGP